MSKGRRRLVRSLVAGLIVLGASGAVVAYMAEPASSSSYATLDGRRIVLRGRAPTVASVLAGEHRQLHDGALKSAGTGRVLDPHVDPALVFLRGAVAAPNARVHPNDVLTVVDGADRVEATELRTTALPPPPLPDVERVLWHPGVAGEGVAQVGSVSGEIVREVTVTRPPVPPYAETGKVVALSFDDGPTPQWTPQVLAILADKQVHAMFCVVGYAIRWAPQLPQLELAQGHTICNHTADHVEHLDTKPHADIVGEIGRGTNMLAADLGGTRPLFYRPPGGSLSPEVIDVAHGHGERVITWSIDPDDFKRPPAPVLLQRIMERVQPGSIILLHDGGGDRSQTVALLPALIDALRAQGYTFVTPYVS